jgi:O-antigen/teichoic acid export membrane protein
MSDLADDPTVNALAAAELKHSVRRSAVALAAAQVVSQLISIAALAILLRQLSPGDYGLVGMILPLVMFLRIFTTLGLNVATIQRPEIRPEETSALFWLNVLLGVATAVVMAILAPQLGWLYAQPDSVIALRNVAWALAGTSVVAALGAQHQALLERNMRLANVGAIRIAAQLAGVVAAVAAALGGWGVWALVVQQYVELSVISALVWWAEPWRPGWPASGASIGAHLKLGGCFAAASIVFYVADNLDRVLIGRLVGPEAVGIYGQAYNVMIKPVYIVVTPLIPLMLASLSRAAGHPETRRQLAISYYRMLAIVLLPASAGLLVVGDDVMRLLGGEAWAAAGPVLAVLSLGLFGQALVIIGGTILTAAGRSDRLFAASLVVAAVLCTAYLAGWWWGERIGAPVLGVAWGYAIAVLGIIAVPFTCFALRTGGYPIRDVVQPMCLSILAAIAMAGVVDAVSEGLTLRGVESPLLRLLVVVPLGALVYLGFTWRHVKWMAAQLRLMVEKGRS